MKPQTILFLDLASTTGWACAHELGWVQSGVWQLATKGAKPPTTHRERFRALHARLGAWLYTYCGGSSKRLVVAREAPAHHFPSTAQARLALGFSAVVDLWSPVPVVEVAPNTLKKHATGSGRAQKDAMVLAARARWGSVVDHPLFDDNEADALCGLDWYLDTHGGEA